MTDVSVIVVNCNGEALLDDCLSSLRDQSYRGFEVVLVDNGSTDKSIPRARELMPQVRVIALTENTGFARGANLGIEAAVGRFIVVLNNDTRADKDFLGELVKVAESSDGIGMVAPKILNFRRPEVIDSVGGLLVCRDGIGQGRGRGEVDAGQYDGVAEGLIPSACAALYRRSMLEDVGLFAEEFFAYCEDTDLGLRGIWAGWKTAVAPRAVVFHKYSASSGSYSPFKLYLVERNHFFVALRNFPLRALAPMPLWTAYRYALMAYAACTGAGKGQAATEGGMRLFLGALLRGIGAAVWDGLGQLRRRPPRKRIGAGEFASLLERYRMPIHRLVLNG
jgi:GT2 family glycosyltransferase